MAVQSKVGGNRRPWTAVSLFSGAGGLDWGLAQANIVAHAAVEKDSTAAATLKANHPCTSVVVGDASAPSQKIWRRDLDMVFGGPPCQGFSVAGKMDPQDPRNGLLLAFLHQAVAASPSVILAENVKALGALARWAPVRAAARSILATKYCTAVITLNAAHFGVPQNRDRVFVVAVRRDRWLGDDASWENALRVALNAYRAPSGTVRDVLIACGVWGTSENPSTCDAIITYARRPVLRGSAYGGMLFNGAGRPLRLDGPSCTLPASMGGNRTPLVDEEELRNGVPSYVEAYWARLKRGESPLLGQAPSRLRRLTTRECQALQTFPTSYAFSGGKSAVYRQIGNAVPCRLAEAVGRAVRDVVDAL